MRIVAAAVQMASVHNKQESYEKTESLRAWIGNRRPDAAQNSPQTSAGIAPRPEVQISDTGKTAQSNETSGIKDSIDAAKNDPMLRLIRAMIAMLTGREVEVFDTSQLGNTDTTTAVPATTQSAQTTPSQQPAGFGVEYERHESYSESEQTAFQSSGVVLTEDGREVRFDISLAMARSYHEESNVSIRLGDARRTQDPLVINFSGMAAQLTNQRFQFDLNADGQTEEINFVTRGSGFLAFDRNNDGLINDGSELFGAKTGDGFSELANLDSDKNGWIDENDAAYQQLGVWRKDANGEDQLSSLKEANVGAISLAHVATPFDIKNETNDLQGQVRSSGVFLQEDGRAGTIQQIDLTV